METAHHDNQQHPAPNSKMLTDDEATRLADEAVALTASWLSRADQRLTDDERVVTERLQGVVADPDGVVFAMGFVDRVIRPEDHAVAAGQLAGLVNGRDLPGFLSPVDRLLLRAGAALGPALPSIVMPLARRRMRQLVGHLVVDADDGALGKHLAARRSEDFRLNVNQLGEAVLGRREADNRLNAALELLGNPDIDYVSVKVSGVVPRLNLWAYEESIELVVERLRGLYQRAATTGTFVNLDMEEYHDLELTMAVFRRLLDEPAFHTVDAGIVLQAYLPDSYEALQELVAWANRRRATVVDGKRGGEIKIRLVKGANLAMERVDAAMHGWEQAPYRSKHESDANYKRCLDWVLNPANTEAVRIGVASHNLFDVAFARLLAQHRGVSDRIEFEMLEGMAAGLARTIRDESGGLLLYTPVVDRDDFDVAISYLFRRLEENASDGNFIRHLFDLATNPSSFAREEDRFRTALQARNGVGYGPQRLQDRAGEASGGGPGTPLDGLTAAPRWAETGSDGPSPFDFVNEPDSDPALASTRTWARSVMERAADPATAQTKAGIETSTVVIDDLYARARSAAARWAAETPTARRNLLYAAADQLVQRRGDLIATMVAEANKTFEQADVEVSEAIDFARWYGDRTLELTSPTATFEPHGVVAVIPPWNFPVAIPAGGVLAALAAGNAVIFKPAPQVPRCSELVTECLHDAGIDPDLVNYVRTEDNEVGRHLVSHPDCDAVILTGAYETAELFRSWKPDLRILAETSGKNSLIITANADIDEAVADLVYSAFGHGGQKCSAASLAILVGPVARSERFRNQLIDAVTSLIPGPAQDLTSDLSPLIEEPTGKLARALTKLEPGESWLIEPRRISEGLWTPGVRLGVQPDSWFHHTECFGPVLGIMEAPDLETAIALQNGVAYGLTGGIHTLDPDEIDQWLETVEVGNAYVNRATTGAIVRRQPFGGWKRSSIGPGAKAGGVNYLRQLGQWIPTIANLDLKATDSERWLDEASASDRLAWSDEFGVPEDHAGLFCEANVFRYRPLPAIGLIGADLDPVAAQRCRSAAAVAGVPIIEGTSPADVLARTANAGGPRVRVVGAAQFDAELLQEIRAEAHSRELHLADDPVTADGRQELLYYLREQSVSRTLHRHGNVLNGEQL